MLAVPVIRHGNQSLVKTFLIYAALVPAHKQSHREAVQSKLRMLIVALSQYDAKTIHKSIKMQPQAGQCRWGDGLALLPCNPEMVLSALFVATWQSQTIFRPLLHSANSIVETNLIKKCIIIVSAANRG
jgi:hypothetical protein